GLADEAIRFADGQLRRRAAAGKGEGGGAGESEHHHEHEEPTEHGLHHTSLVKCEVRGSEWRYRLGVRTRGSQPRDRGSIPRTATIIIAFGSCNHPLGNSPGRWPGLFICGFRWHHS